MLDAIRPGSLNLPPLQNDEIHLLRFSVSDWLGDASEFKAQLSQTELERAERYRFPQHTDAFIVRRGLLRLLLERYTGIPSQSCQIEYGDYGKPFVNVDSLRFNLSHSQDAVLFAFSKDVQVGVDIEHQEYLSDIESISKTVMCKQEIAAFGGLGSEEKLHAFYRLWTRKEALVKALGVGLSISVQEIEVSTSPKAKLQLASPEFGDINLWSLHNVSISNRYYASVAYRSRSHRLKYIQGREVS